jgi:hypothetical protein
MGGPDYTWWHGFYDIAHNFYFELIPQAREFENPEVNAYIDKLLKEDPMHNWFSRNTEELKKGIRSGAVQKVYRDLFQEK